MILYFMAAFLFNMQALRQIHVRLKYLWKGRNVERMTSRLFCIWIGCLLLGSSVALPTGRLIGFQHLRSSVSLMTETKWLYSVMFIKVEECNGIEEPRRFILCYANSLAPFTAHLDVCRCSHLVVPLAVNITQNNGSIALDEGNLRFISPFQCRG